MILTMTPKTLFVGRSARNGRTANEGVLRVSDIVSGGIHIVIMGHNTLVQRNRTLISGDGSRCYHHPLAEA